MWEKYTQHSRTQHTYTSHSSALLFVIVKTTQPLLQKGGPYVTYWDRYVGVRYKIVFFFCLSLHSGMQYLHLITFQGFWGKYIFQNIYLAIFHQVADFRINSQMILGL